MRRTTTLLAITATTLLGMTLAGCSEYTGQAISQQSVEKMAEVQAQALAQAAMAAQATGMAPEDAMDNAVNELGQLPVGDNQNIDMQTEGPNALVVIEMPGATGKALACNTGATWVVAPVSGYGNDITAACSGVN